VNAVTSPPDLKGFHQFRWRAVFASFLLVFFLAGAALAEVWNQNATLDGRVNRQIAQSRQIVKAVDSVRQPLCSILYVALSRPVVGLTREQLQARVEYYRAYGPGTAQKPGLNCPRPLPTQR
jgi:hypothetical protein